LRQHLGVKRWFLSVIAPLGVVYAYRLIPDSVRGGVCRRIGASKPTSHLAVRDLKQGLGWPAFWKNFWASGDDWQ
jgi:hypothetical protein